MNFKQYIYEFFGFAMFYSISGLIFGFESSLICFIAGIVGAYGGKFISKVNGFFFEKIINYNFTPLITGTNEFNVDFEILAKYKLKQISILAHYSSKNIIDLDTLSILLYNKINQSYYKKILEYGTVSIEIKMKNETIKLFLRTNKAK